MKERKVGNVLCVLDSLKKKAQGTMVTVLEFYSVPGEIQYVFISHSEYSKIPQSADFGTKQNREAGSADCGGADCGGLLYLPCRV